MQNLHNAAPPGVPIDRRRMRKSASFVAPVDDDYIAPDTPRTAARKELDRKMPKMTYKAQPSAPLKPLSPRAQQKFEEKTRAIYKAQRGEDGEAISDDLRAKVRDFKAAAVPDYKSLAMDIYHAKEDGMEQRAIRKLQATELSRPQQEYREKAFQAYYADPRREAFAHATEQLNQDDYLWQRQGEEHFPRFAKTQDRPLVQYRNRKMQRPSHVGNFHELSKAERKERNMLDGVGSKYQPSEEYEDEGYEDTGFVEGDDGVGEQPPPSRT